METVRKLVIDSGYPFLFRLSWLIPDENNQNKVWERVEFQRTELRRMGPNSKGGGGGGVEREEKSKAPRCPPESHGALSAAPSLTQSGKTPFFCEQSTLNATAPNSSGQLGTLIRPMGKAQANQNNGDGPQ